MALYLIERRFARRFELSRDEVGQVRDVCQQLGVHWLFSFLSTDGRTSYCVYEAEDPAVLAEQGQVLGLPMNAITRVRTLDPRAQGT